MFTDLGSVFDGATVFNADLSKWDTSKIRLNPYIDEMNPVSFRQQYLWNRTGLVNSTCTMDCPLKSCCSLLTRLNFSLYSVLLFFFLFQIGMILV